MRKTILLGICILVILLSSCTKEPEILYTQTAIVEYWPFEVVAARCTHVLTAEYIGYDTEDRELEFEVNASIKGRITDKAIYVAHESVEITVGEHEYNPTDITYTKGNIYTLFLEKNVSVYNEHDVYVQLGDIFIPHSDIGSSLMYAEPITEHSDKKSGFATVEDLHLYVMEIAVSSTPVPEQYGAPFAKSDTLEESLEVAGAIFEVSVGEPRGESQSTSTQLYEFDVIKTIKGEPRYKTNLTAFFDDTVVTGERYIVMLVGDSSSIVYTLSSKTQSVFTIEEAKNNSLIQPLLESAIEFTEKEPPKTDEEIFREEQNAIK